MAYQTTLQVAQVTQFLTADKKYNNSVFNWGNLKGQGINPFLLQMYQETLNWAATYYAGTAGFISSTNYTFALIGAYYNQALSILNSATGGSSISPTPITSVSPYPISHTVTAGESGVQFVTNSAWVGLQYINWVVINQSVLQLNTDFTFNTITGTFDFGLYGYILQQGDKISSLGFKQLSSNSSIANVSMVLQTQRIQFIIGESGSPLNNGDTVYTITDTNVIQNSLSIELDTQGSLPIGIFTDRVALSSVTYSNTGIVSVFNQAVMNGQLYVVSYLKYVSA